MSSALYQLTEESVRTVRALENVGKAVNGKARWTELGIKRVGDDARSLKEVEKDVWKVS